MASTYSNSLRLELIASGEAASTWGDKTNVNLTNIAAAFGYATQDGFAANADSTTTVADGAADPARAMYFKVTSSATLTATRTLTIAPNTISRLMWIENATTGGQSIAISQGTGANVTILTGKTAVVYLDGAGSGAAVVDAMLGVDPGVTDTLAEVLTAGNTTTTDQKIQFRDTGIYINSSADGQLDIVADTEIQIAATTVDLNGNLDISGTATGASSFETAAGGTFTTAAGNDLNIVYPSGRSLFIKEGSETHVTVDNVGNVGLGTTNPAAYGQFTVSGAGNLVNLNAESGKAYQGFFEGGTGRFYLSTLNGSKGLAFVDGNGATERGRFDASGNFLVRQSSPQVSDTHNGGTVEQFWGNQFSSSNSTNTKVMIGTGSNEGYVGASRLSSSGQYVVNSYIRFDNTNATAGSDAGQISFFTQTGGTNAAQRMAISATGTVGIGMAPDANNVLSVKNTSGKVINLTNGTSADLYVDLTNGVSLVSPSTGILAFGTSNTERMRLTSVGLLEVQHDAYDGMQRSLTLSNPRNAAGSGDGTSIYFNNTGTSTIARSAYIGSVSETNYGQSNALVFGVSSGGNAPTEAARLDSSGNLLLGLSSVGATPNQGFGVAISGTSSNGNIKTVGNGTHTHFTVVNTSNVVGSITSNSSSTAYNTSSDQRLKENIADADDAGSKIDAIQVRKFDWKADGSHQDYGMVAQELQAVAPEAVSAPEDPEEMMGVDYSKLVPMMLKEIQSLRARITQLES